MSSSSVQRHYRSSSVTIEGVNHGPAPVRRQAEWALARDWDAKIGTRRERRDCEKTRAINI